jgi:hypothetical protein
MANHFSGEYPSTRSFVLTANHDTVHSGHQYTPRRRHPQGPNGWNSGGNDINAQCTVADRPTKPGHGTHTRADGDLKGRMEIRSRVSRQMANPYGHMATSKKDAGNFQVLTTATAVAKR